MSVMWFFKIIIILYYLPLQTKELNRQLKNVPVVNKKDIINQIMLNKKNNSCLKFSSALCINEAMKQI